jgi:peroxiredoxin
MKWRSLEESTPGTDTRPLREIFAERKNLIAQYVPAETQAVHARVIADLKQRGLAASSLQPGARAPEFTLLDQNDRRVSSTDLLAKGPVVLCFFRGRWDPFCCGQLEAMNRILPEIEQSGATLAAISPQTTKQAFFMADQHRLRFPLLRDEGNQLANGDQSWELPIPATYILDKNGTVFYASANEDYTERPEPAEIFHRLSR